MKQNLAYYKAQTNSEIFRAVTLHCVSTPIKSYKAKLQRFIIIFFCFGTFPTRFLGVETQCNFKAGLLAAYHKLKFSEVINN